MIQAHLVITGYVQGVGYRQFVKNHARQLGLTGWVQNLPDGSVEVLVQGEKKDIESLIKECRKGPFLAQVKDIKVEWQDIKNRFSDFQIYHTNF